MKVKDEMPDIIDLTQDEDSGLPPASRLQSDPTNEHDSPIRPTRQKNSEPKAYVIAEDNAHAALPELLDCLTHEELKGIGKELKVTRTGQTVSVYHHIVIPWKLIQPLIAFKFNGRNHIKCFQPENLGLPRLKSA